MERSPYYLLEHRGTAELQHGILNPHVINLFEIRISTVVGDTTSLAKSSGPVCLLHEPCKVKKLRHGSRIASKIGCNCPDEAHANKRNAQVIFMRG